jgi:maleate isomerase
VLAHTATSYVLGRDGDAKLARRMEELTGIPFISALGSAVAAFEALGVRRVAVGTPYDQALTLRGKAVLEEYGIDVVHAECLPDVTNIFEETPRRVYGLIKSATAPRRRRCSSAASACRPSRCSARRRPILGSRCCRAPAR